MLAREASCSKRSSYEPCRPPHGGVKEGLQLVEKDPQPLGVILHLEDEVEKGINIVII